MFEVKLNNKMECINAVYSAIDVNNLLELLNVNVDQIRNLICEEQENLQCLKLALEIYHIRAKNENIGKIDFPSAIVKKRNADNISTICDILKLSTEHQYETQLSHASVCIKNLDFNKEDELLVNLQLVSTFIKHNGIQKGFDDSFIIFLRDIVVAQNVKTATNYYITNILKPYFQLNPVSKETILTEIIATIDLYIISCLIQDIPLYLFTESFLLHLQHICYKKTDHWEYKLAVNILKSFIKSVQNDNFYNIPDIIRAETRNCIEFHYQWKNFFTLLEVSEEKQLHLVQPSLGLLKNIDKLAFIWMQCIFEKLLNHVQLSVVYESASIIIDVKLKSINDYRDCIKSLLLGINKSDFSEYAQNFFKKFECYVLDIEPKRYSLLLKESARINWTPLAAWLFYSHCTKRFSSFILNLSDMENIKLILRNLEKVPHRYIRNGCFDLFYKKLKCTSNITADIFEIFKSYNDKYSDEKQIANSFQKVEHKLEDTIHVLLNPDNYDEITLGSVYNHYNNKFDDVKYTNQILMFWKKQIETRKVCSKICREFIEHLSNYIAFYDSDLNTIKYTDIEDVLDKIVSTQNNDIYKVIYQHLGILTPSSGPVMIRWFRELENIKCYETRKFCTDSYFEHFFEDFHDNGWEVTDEICLIIFESIYENEQIMFGYLKRLPPSYYDDDFHFILLLKALYFGDALTKHKKYEDEVCYQIFLEKGLLNQDNEPTLETTIRLNALNACLYAIQKKPLLLSKLLEFPNKRYFPNSPVHLRYLRLTQTILLLIKNQNFHTRELFDIILDNLMYESHQPSVRQMMQWILIRLCANDNFCSELIKEFKKTSHSDSALTSLMVVLYHIGLTKANSVQTIIDVMLEYTMGAVFKLRVYSQVAIFNLITHRKLQGQYSTLYNVLKKTLENNKTAVNKLLNTDLDIFEVFDPVKNYHIKTILIDIPKLNNLVLSEWCYIEYYLKNNSKYNNLLLMDANKSEFLPLTKETTFLNNLTNETENMETDTINIQKKIVPTAVLINNSKVNTDLIVIASLVTSSANLGGLARTCEIYGVKKLIVHNVKVVNDKEFKSLSMSSERWLNMVEVKNNNLIKYISEEKDKGYTVIGAEQTCDSIKLNDYKFPCKCILILGNEKEGIPFNLLPYLDVCLEIPQFGVIRSLNVHVAGSTFIWEYIKQISLQ